MTANRNPSLYAYSGTCGSLVSIGCANNNNTNGSQTETLNLTGLVIGNQYYIRTGNVNNNYPMTINSFIISTITNNNCSGAISLTPSSDDTCNATTGTTVGATQSQTGCTGNADDDVWYSFVATSTSHVILATTPGGSNGINDIIYQVFTSSGTCGSLVSIGCIDGTGGYGDEGAILTAATVGNTYYIRLYSYYGNENQGTFNICVTTPPPSVPTTGNNSYDLCSGILYDSGGSTGNYAINSSGYTVLNPATPGNYVEVSGSITAEGGYDYLTIYDGAGTGGTILWGGSPHGTGTSCSTFTIPTITSVTGSLTVQFNSDFSGNCSGFALNIACSSTPGTVTLCIPSISPGYQPPNNYIRSIAFKGTLLDINNPSTYSNPTPRGYQDFTGLATKARQAQGEGVNVYVETVNSGYYKAWIDWNNDDIFSVGELVYDAEGVSQSSTTFGFVIPPATPPGNYRIRIRMSGRNADAFGTDAGSNWGPCGNLAYYGETEDYLFTVVPSCSANITGITDGEACGRSTVDLSVTGSGGTTEFRWYANETGGAILATTASGDWTTPQLSSTRVYYVTAYNGSCESWVRTAITAKINPVPTVTFNPTAPSVCGDEDIIQLTAQGDRETVYLIDEDFESGLGGFTNTNIINNGATLNNLSNWQNRSSTYVPDLFTWKPAIASGFGTNRFAMATSDIGQNPSPPYNVYNTHNAIVSPSVNTTGFLNLTLELRMFHSRYYVNNVNQTLEYVTIDVSTNGTSWTEIDRLVRDVGIGTKFEELTPYSLNAYIGQPNFRVRVRYYAEWCDGLAIDDVKLHGEKPLNTAFHYNPTNVDAFTDAAATIPYISGDPITTIYIKPTMSQLELPSFNIPVSATLSNGCSATGSTVVTNNTKIYTGSTNDWTVNNDWKPTLQPDINKCVVITNGKSPRINNGVLGAARNVTVKDGGFLDMRSGSNLTVQDWIKVEPNAIFNLQNSASLVQVNDVTTKPNTGTVHVQRAPKSDFSAVGNLNYVYWSSPVDGFNLGQISPGTSSSLLWQWAPTISGNGTGSHGDWQQASGTMIKGKGYIVRGLSGTPTVIPSTTVPVSSNTALFSGVPNNGVIAVNITRGSYTGTNYNGMGNTATSQDDNWNLLGNPYPSAISANAFVTLNTNINGTVYLWPHESLPVTTNDDPFYGDFGLNYANSYVQHNPSGAIPPSVGDLYIASGQSFMTLMKDSPTGSSETVYFNNSLRNATQPNTNFYRESDSVTTHTPEKHRIWLDLSASDNTAHTLLVGYIENATNEVDRLYDGYNFVDDTTNFYSLIAENTFSIQGRALPFLQDDTVPLGLSLSNNDIYKIGINTLDGLFVDGSQNIFLEDTYLGITHNLRNSPYTFTSNSGTFNDRFILRYTDQALSTPDQVADYDFNIIGLKDYVKVTSGNSPISTVKVYDVLGRLLADYKDVNTLEFKFDMVNQSEGALIVKATLYNGQQKIKKVIY